MNVSKGVRRMQTAGRWMIMVPLTALLVAMAVWLAKALLRADVVSSPLPILMFVPLLAPLAVIGGVLWLAGWILEGFMKDAD
jgi:hypothetical protein